MLLNSASTLSAFKVKKYAGVFSRTIPQKTLQWKLFLKTLEVFDCRKLFCEVHD